MLRTISLKLRFGVALVTLSLCIASAGGLYGMYSYQAAIAELDLAINKAPHPVDLAAGMSQVLEALLIKATSERGGEFQQRQVRQALLDAQSRISEYRLRLEEMPPTEFVSRQRLITDALLADLTGGVAALGREVPKLGDPQLRREARHEMLHVAARLQTVAHRVPDPVGGMLEELARLRRVYRNSTFVTMGATIFAMVIFSVLAYCARRWISHPIKALQRDARIIADGDYKHRVHLETKDEMADLAEVLNKMTSRFQEVRDELDQQVRERCNQLVRSERLAGVGFLSAGVAHEINNPLAAILVAAESSERRLGPALTHLPPDEAELIKKYLRMIQTEADRCRQITRKLLDFTRGQDARRAPIDIVGLMREVLDVVSHLGKFKGRTIQFDPPRGIVLEVNGPEIKQVFLNLVANALDAMDEHGTLRIQFVEQIDHVVAIFHDDGCGMTPEVVAHLFEPFFTHKRGGRGTGLGLSISHRIVSEHGGTIEAGSPGPNQGSTFRIRLPRRPAQGAAA